MCIVSFVLDKGKFILTFNRDERTARSTEDPAWHNGVFYPKDKEAGGTWIGYNHKIVACLQNGALVKHERKLPYRKSRGLILKEILENPDFESLLTNKYFENIEPFTMSIYFSKKKEFKIYRYDGHNLTGEIKNMNEPVILASCTLYDALACDMIENDFKVVEKDANSLFKFHDEHRIGNVKNKYTNLVSTVSITQLILENGKLDCHYYDALPNLHSHYK